MDRILFYVHYNKKNLISPHVKYQIDKIRPIFKSIVFISNSKLTREDKIKLESICDKVIERQNYGFDFAAWRDGISYLGWKKLMKYDSMTLMNDTTFGPIYSLKYVYEKMEEKKINFWGITDHAYSKNGMPGDNSEIPYHIQSYMIVYDKKMIQSEIFQKFWHNVKNYTDINLVIKNYETKLTGLFNNAGFTSDVFFRTIEYSNNHNITIHNYAELLPKILLKNKTPLLKIKSFQHIPIKIIFKFINKTDYPTHLIKDHLGTMNIKNVNTLHFYFTLIKSMFYGYAKLIYNKLNNEN